MENAKPIRAATKSGSWYSASKQILEDSFSHYLAPSSNLPKENSLKALISPHAGYEYSLKTALQGYRLINPSKFSKIVILGPNHYTSSRICLIPNCKIYKSSFCDFPLDINFLSSLNKNVFSFQNVHNDEREHSIELQMPILSYLFKESPALVSPIIVGQPTEENIEKIAKELIPAYKDNKTLFIISSDFCHWGYNFDYFRFNENDYKLKDRNNVNEFIEKMDKEGINYIMDKDYENLNKYLDKTGNTICGIYPIKILMKIREMAGIEGESVLLDYSRSGEVEKDKVGSSSVGYAAIGFYDK